MLRYLIRLVTVAALLAALGVSLWWWMDPQREWLQAPSTALVLVAAVAGIPADRWAAENQRRSRSVTSLRHEMEQNREILRDARFSSENQGVGQVYPRLVLGAVDMAFISGSLDMRRDRALRRTLLDWRNAAEDLNRRLDLTEQRLCMVDYLRHDDLATLREIRRPDGYFDQVCGLLERLDGELGQAPDRPRWLTALHARAFQAPGSS